jgi:hypothetical protein
MNRYSGAVTQESRGAGADGVANESHSQTRVRSRLQVGPGRRAELDNSMDLRFGLADVKNPLGPRSGADFQRLKNFARILRNS